MEFSVYNAKFDSLTKGVDWDKFRRIYGHGDFDLERNLRIRYLFRNGVPISAISEGLGLTLSPKSLYAIKNRVSDWLDDIEARLGLLEVR